MARHILAANLSSATPIRRQVSFIRNDLLLDGETVSPQTGEVVVLPIAGENALVGPAISHCLSRTVVHTATLPKHQQVAAKAANAGIEPEYAAVWKLLDTAALWRTSDPPLPREPSAAKDDRLPEHPFKPELVTGGKQHGEAENGLVPVRKSSTVWVSDGAFRLAAAMHGGADQAAKRIGEVAAIAWDDDLSRCLDFHDAISDAGPDGLLETANVLALRPDSSVSQEVEKEILDEALRWLGVDPTENLTRTPGRRKAPGDDGDIITVDVDAEGRVHGHLRQSCGGWTAATKLVDIPYHGLSSYSVSYERKSGARTLTCSKPISTLPTRHGVT